MPLAQRLPKLRGFTNINRREFAVVNLGKLNRFEAGTEVNPELLKEVGLVRKRLGGVKILAAGELKVALKVSAHRISAGAQAQIEKAGGSIELIGPQTADKTPRRHKAAKAKPKPRSRPRNPRRKPRVRRRVAPRLKLPRNHRRRRLLRLRGRGREAAPEGAPKDADGSRR